MMQAKRAGQPGRSRGICMAAMLLLFPEYWEPQGGVRWA